MAAGTKFHGMTYASIHNILLIQCGVTSDRNIFQHVYLKILFQFIKGNFNNPTFALYYEFINESRYLTVYEPCYITV